MCECQHFPRLVSEIAIRGIKKVAIAERIGVSRQTLQKKIRGVVPFTWPEACIIQSTFFPGVSKDDLFATR